MEQAEAVAKSLAMLQSRNRGRECLEQMRRLYRALLLSRESSFGAEVQDLKALMFKSLQDPKTPKKLMSFFEFLLALAARGELGFLKVDLLQTYDAAFAALLSPLLMQVASVATLKRNVQCIVGWVASAPFLMGAPPTSSPSSSAPQTQDSDDAQLLTVQSAVYGMYMLAKEQRESLQYASHIKPFENQLVRVLSKASKTSRLKGGGFFKIGTSVAQTPTTELDGKPTLELFTVLTSSTSYSDDQLLNIQTFCQIRSWLSAVYLRPPLPQEEMLTRKLDTGFRDCIIDYCLRVLTQARLVVSEEFSIRSSGVVRLPHLRSTIAACVAEAVRILDVLCSVDNSVVSRVFPMVRSVPVVSLEVLEFLLHHAPSSSDFDPLFRTFFATFAFSDPLNCYEFVSFCNTNKEALKAKNLVFKSFFPLILKALAWHPLSLCPGVMDLLDCIVTDVSFVEVLHAILDLPLMAAAMEDVMGDEEELGEGESGVLDPILSSESQRETSDADPFRVVRAHLTRNESTPMSQQSLSDSSTAMFQGFANSKSVHPSARVIEVTKVAPQLLERVCDVLLERRSEKQLEELLRLLFLRIPKLSPIGFLEQGIKQVFENKILAIFHSFPQFIWALKDLVISHLSSGSFNAGELTLNLCWMIGEHSRVCSQSQLREYHEVIELFTYERLSLSKMSEEKEKTFQSRLMLALISCQCKLASRDNDLNSRVVLCLNKILIHQSYFVPAVAKRVSECIRLLQFPAQASVIFGTPNSYPVREQRVDANSSFEMITKLRTTCPDAMPW